MAKEQFSDFDLVWGLLSEGGRKVLDVPFDELEKIVVGWIVARVCEMSLIAKNI